MAQTPSPVARRLVVTLALACAGVAFLRDEVSSGAGSAPLVAPLPAPAPAKAQDPSLPQVGATAQMVTLEFPPLEFADEQGQARGAAVSIVRETMENLGFRVDVQVLPWARSIALVKEGRADAIFTAYKNDERETFLDYSSEVLIPQVVSLYTKKAATHGFGGDYKVLVGKIIGIVSTISYGESFDKARQTLGLKTDRVESLDLNFKKLVAGRVDYVISNRYSAEVEIERLKLGAQVQELSPPVEITPSFLAFSKKSPFAALKPKFDQALRELRKSGRYQRILEEFKVNTPK